MLPGAQAHKARERAVDVEGIRVVRLRAGGHVVRRNEVEARRPAHELRLVPDGAVAGRGGGAGDGQPALPAHVRADLAPAGAVADGAAQLRGARGVADGARVEGEDGDLGHVQVVVPVEDVHARVAARERAPEGERPARRVLLEGHGRAGRRGQLVGGHELHGAVDILVVVRRVADVEVEVVQAVLAAVLAVVDLDHGHGRREAEVDRDVVVQVAVRVREVVVDAVEGVVALERVVCRIEGMGERGRRREGGGTETPTHTASSWCRAGCSSPARSWPT